MTTATAQELPALKLVPFNEAWINHDKIDVHAIYRRPRFVEDAFGELQREYDAHGLPTWDLTGALPIKQHNRWRAKGFEYVTLADKASLYVAGMNNTIENWRQFDQHKIGGPWNYRLYVSGQQATYTREAEQLKADVNQFGSDAVERIRRQREPDFALPDHLRNTPPGGKVKIEEPKIEAPKVDASKPADKAKVGA